MTLPGRIDCTIGCGDDDRRRAAHHQRGADDQVVLGDGGRHQLGLLLAERLAHLAGIGAGLAGGLGILDADEAAARAT